MWRSRSDNIEQISSYIKSKDKVEKRKKAKQLFVLYTFLIFLMIVGVSISVDNIEAVFNIIGAICSSSIGVLLPCFFYFQLIKKKKKTRTSLYYITIAIFSIMAPFALFSIVAQYL
jgi:amino acid permease